jgi:multidrug efflux pump subunit AcrA (membrane-fusion protein)
MHNRKSIKRGCVFATALLINSVCSNAATELELEGTTQFLTVDKYLEVPSDTSLKIAEFYVQSGSTVNKGDNLLKITDESYQDALDYYSAAVLRAENNLTQAELDYTQTQAKKKHFQF